MNSDGRVCKITKNSRETKYHSISKNKRWLLLLLCETFLEREHEYQCETYNLSVKVRKRFLFLKLSEKNTKITGEIN